MRKILISTMIIFVLACILTAGCTTENTKEVQNYKKMYDLKPIACNIEGNYSVVSLIGYQEI